MNGKAIQKHFDKLTARERAILSINASGRGDKSEATRLIDASPRATLDAPDCGRWAMRVVNVIEWHCLSQAQNAANFFLVMRFADADAGKYPDVDGAVNVCAYNIITRADGWRIFCGELGLDPVGALRVAAADELLFEMAEQIAQAVNPDVDAIREKLRETFPNSEAEPKTAEQIAAEYRDLVNASSKTLS